MKKTRLILLFLLLLSGQGLVAQTSIKSGNWDDPTLWNTGSVPASGATVIINNGHTVTRSGSLSLASLTVQTALTVTGDVTLTGALTLAGGSSFGVSGSLSIPGNFSHNGVVTIGGNLMVGGSATITANATLNLSVGGNFQAGGTITNNGHVEITGTCNSLNGSLVNAAGCTFSTGGSLHAKTGMTNGGELTIGGSCTIDGGGITNSYDKNIIIGGDLTVSGGTTNQGLFVVNGDFDLLTGNLSVSFSEMMVVNGNFTKSGNVNLDGMLIVSGDFISTGGTTTINQYNGNFYAFNAIDENGSQAGCTESCFPKENCSTCQIKGLGGWNADGMPGQAYVVFVTPWWEDHLLAVGESDGPETACPGYSMTFSLPAVTTGVGDLTENLFEWAVYGGTITGFNGTTVSAHNGTIDGHPAAYQSVGGITGVTTYTLEVQWENTQFDGAYVAVRQTSAFGCSDGLWSVFYIHIDQVAPPTGDASQAFCSSPVPTVAGLEATGENILWYLNSSGGAPLDPATELNNGFYYASQTVNGCESVDRLAVQVTITPLPEAAISYAGTPFCQATQDPQPVTLTGTTGGTFSASPAGLTIDPATGAITPSVSDPGEYTVSYTIAAAGNCGPVTVTTPVAVIGYLSWNGSVSSDWNTPANWSCGVIPNLTTDARIPLVANQPVLSSGTTGAVRDLILESGTSLAITGNTLQIGRDIVSNGTITATEGAIEMKGNAAQVIGAGTFAGNTLQDLIVNNPSGVTLLGALNVSGTVVPVAGNLASDGYLTLLSTDSRTALIAASETAGVTGNVTMQRYLPAAFGYHFISSPFESAAVSELGDDLDLTASFPTFYSYDENNHSDSAGIPRYTAGWVTYLSGPLEPMRGYAANFGNGSAPTTIDITGTVNNHLTSTLTLYNNNRQYTKGFNLVGNPYPSPINWDAPSGWIRNNIDDAAYFFNAGSTQYTGTYSAYINGVSSNGIASAHIAAMQGFFVHVSDLSYPVTGTLGMSNEVRTLSPNIHYHKSGEFDTRPLIRISARFEAGTATDQTAVYFDGSATAGFSPDRDALKMLNTDEQVPSLFSITASRDWLSVNGLPDLADSLTVISLGLVTSRPGWVEFMAPTLQNLPAGMHVYFTDAETGMHQDMQNSSGYRVFLNAGEHLRRFSLKMSMTDLAAFTTNPAGFIAYSSGDYLLVKLSLDRDDNALLSVSSLTGQVVWRLDVSGMAMDEIRQPLASGIYIVSLYRSTGIQSQKVYIPPKQ